MDELWRVGRYFIAKRDDNPYCADYTELLLVNTRLLSPRQPTKRAQALYNASLPAPPLTFLPGPAHGSPGGYAVGEVARATWDLVVHRGEHPRRQRRR